MTVVDQKVDKAAGIARKKLTGQIITAIDQTATVTSIEQVPHPFVVTRLQNYCSALAGAASVNVGILRPGKVLQAVALAIGTTKSKFKLNAAITALAPHLPVLPCMDTFRHIINKAITDNIAFSSAFTVNAAAATGTFYGCVRVQMADDWSDANTPVYTISTKVVSQDQAFTAAADALANCPKADADKIDLGVIKFAVVNVAFTAKTTLMDAAGVTTTFTGIAAAGLVSCVTGDLAFAAGVPQQATDYVPSGTNTSSMLQKLQDRAINQAGGLIVVSYTTNHTGVLTDGRYDVHYRIFPAAGEAIIRGG